MADRFSLDSGAIPWWLSDPVVPASGAGPPLLTAVSRSGIALAQTGNDDCTGVGVVTGLEAFEGEKQSEL